MSNIIQLKRPLKVIDCQEDGNKDTAIALLHIDQAKTLLMHGLAKLCDLIGTVEGVAWMRDRLDDIEGK